MLQQPTKCVRIPLNFSLRYVNHAGGCQDSYKPKYEDIPFSKGHGKWHQTDTTVVERLIVDKPSLLVDSPDFARKKIS